MVVVWCGLVHSYQVWEQLESRHHHQHTQVRRRARGSLTGVSYLTTAKEVEIFKQFISRVEAFEENI